MHSDTQYTGDIGQSGKGGMGGKGASNGKIAKTRSLFLFIGTLNIEDKQVKGARIENAENGKDGISIENRNYPPQPSSFNDQLKIVKDYETFVCENLADHIQESKLRKFLLDLNENEKVQKFSPSGFADELIEMEKRYSKLHHTSVISLRQRIEEYAKKMTPTQNRNYLRYLRAATLSHSPNIQKISKDVRTFDLLEIFCFAQEHIYDLSECKQIDAINEHRRRIAVSIDRKVVFAKEMFEKQIKPNMTKTLAEINDNIQTEINKPPKLVDGRTLNRLLIEQRILFWLEDIGLLILSLSVAGRISVFDQNEIMGK